MRKMNLLSKLHKNSILTGPIDSYCLACGSLLRSEEDSYAHIHEPGHMDKLRSMLRLADYDDCIIKCKEGYFCRYCNIILPTIKRVSLHVAESTHEDNKHSQCITRQAGVILAFDSVVISERSWNGVDGSTCTVCNQDYDDEVEHTSSGTHVLNLIQVRCEVGATFVYRKVDEVLFFCLICNEILPVLEKFRHHETEKHLRFYEKSKTEGTAIRIQKGPESNSTNEAPDTQILNNKVADNKHKTGDNKTQYGSANRINLDRPNNQKLIQEPATLNHKETKPKNETENRSIKTNTVDNKDVAKAVDNSATDNKIKGTANHLHKVEPFFYEYLKANNFMVKGQDGAAYCTLCDICFSGIRPEHHWNDPHHNVLYAKHMAQKATQLAKTINSTKTNKDAETNGDLNADDSKTNKENTPYSQSGKTSIQVKNDTEKVTKDSGDKEKNAPKQNDSQEAHLNAKDESKIDKEVAVIEAYKSQNKKSQQECTIDKENAVPNNKQNDGDTHGLNKGGPTPEAVKTDNPTKRVNKKAQKKAAKAKITITNIPKEALESETAEETTDYAIRECSRDDSNLKKADSNLKTADSNLDAVDSQKSAEISQLTEEIEAMDAIQTEKLLNLLKTVSQVDSTPGDVVINNKHVICNLSFVLVQRAGDNAECVACDKELKDGIHEHIVTEEHKSNVENCFVVTSFDDEFIRQTMTLQYHCGYCNLLLPNWDAMKFHLKTFRHSEAKTSASWRLQRYLPHILNCETREVRSVLTTIFRCTRE